MKNIIGALVIYTIGFITGKIYGYWNLNRVLAKDHEEWKQNKHKTYNEIWKK